MGPAAAGGTVLGKVGNWGGAARVEVVLGSEGEGGCGCVAGGGLVEGDGCAVTDSAVESVTERR